MSLPPSLDTLAIRALNATSSTYKPAYAGLRVLLSTSDKYRDILGNFLERRSLNRGSWRYARFPMVKDAPPDKDPTYRNCSAGSPITNLAEARILGLMARERSFSVPSCAFSYRWPKNSMSGGNFSYFYEGYRDRNLRTGDFLRANPDCVAIIADLKAFYPSVNTQKLAWRFKQRVARVSDRSIGRQIVQFSEAFLAQGDSQPSGIPIGPDFSHMLGHLAVEDVDAKMVQCYGDRYLRYVDDIILIVPGAQVRNAQTALQNAVDAEGLALNVDKQDQLTSVAWQENDPLVTVATSDSFEALMDDLVYFLTTKMPDLDALRRRFEDAGLSLPLTRMVGRSRSMRYWQYLMNRLTPTLWRRSFLATEQSLVRRAQALRNTLFGRAQQSDNAVPVSPTCRRWWAQRWRYVINRLIYLLPFSQYQTLLDLIPAAPEFAESRTLIDALRAGDVSKLLKFPGRCVCAFCQLWRENRGTSVPTVSWPTRPNFAEADSIAHLSLFLGLHPPQAYLDTLGKDYPESRLLIECCGCQTNGAGTATQGSFLDEMRLLFESTNSDEIDQLMATRYDESESVVLDGLLLGDSISECPAYPL